jgi:methionyl-tRNA synthetase
VQTDAIKRFHELVKDQTFLATGADENSLKNVHAAEAEGMKPIKFCDKYSEKFRHTMKLLNLSFDSFMRSSSKEHHEGSQKLWELCKKDIYKKKYKGLYCVGCETFYTQGELSEGKCPEHKTEPELVEEENYFFRLSKYQKQLESLIKAGKLKIYPDSRKNEVISFIKSGLEDFSISRSKERAKDWGVPVPGDISQIMYVWFDALNVYQTSVGFGKDEKQYKKWWPANVHVIGKGIIRFHAVYWPAILLSAGLPLPKSLFVHGYITVNGEKISKSIGNVISPASVVEKYGVDQLRYYVIRDISPFNDGDFSEKSLVERVNEELVSNYSNLFYRVTSFIEKNFDSKVEGNEDKEIAKIIQKKTENYMEKMKQFRLNEALEIAISLSGEGNEYFQKSKPWVSVKNDKKKCADVLYTSAKLLAVVSSLLYPFIPKSAQKALESLGTEKAIEPEIKQGTRIKALMLFKNIELKEELSGAQNKIEMVNGMIPVKEFQKIDFRVGTIKEIKEHPDADKLYIMKIDIGKKNIQIVSGIRDFYDKKDLLGKQITVIVNLEPAKIRGVESQGMLLAAGDKASILVPVKKVKDGEKVR